MNNTSMGMGAMGGMGGGMNPMMMGMDPTMMGMGQGMGGGMNPMMGMGMGGMGMGMGGGMGGMGMGGGMGPTSGGALAGAMGGGDPANDRFYKTKMCHKWEQGSCPYGPTCKYAHGPSDMRQPGGPMQGAAAARGNASGKVMTPNGPPAGGMGMGGVGMGGMGVPMQPRPPAGSAAGGGGGDKNAHWRTRLCDGFMQNGSCRYGDKCTFAHGHHQLRAPGGGGGGMQRSQGGGGSAGQKRGLDQGGAVNEANKRQRRAAGEEVVPPLHESLPGDELPLEEVKRRFWELQQEANKFALDTGFSVALFSVGGIYTQEEDTMDDASCCLSSVKQKDPTASDNLKVAVLKHATGGVANNLITRGEITKFVAQRGVKAISDLWAASQQQDFQGEYQDQEQASA